MILYKFELTTTLRFYKVLSLYILSGSADTESPLTDASVLAEPEECGFTAIATLSANAFRDMNFVSKGSPVVYRTHLFCICIAFGGKQAVLGFRSDCSDTLRKDGSVSDEDNCLREGGTRCHSNAFRCLRFVRKRRPRLRNSGTADREAEGVRNDEMADDLSPDTRNATLLRR